MINGDYGSIVISKNSLNLYLKKIWDYIDDYKIIDDYTNRLGISNSHG